MKEFSDGGKKSLIRSLFRHLNRTYLVWRGKLKRVGKIWWDEVNKMYAPEGEGHQFIQGILMEESNVGMCLQVGISFE